MRVENRVDRTVVNVPGDRRRMDVVPYEFVFRVGEAVGGHMRPNFIEEALL